MVQRLEKIVTKSSRESRQMKKMVQSIIQLQVRFSNSCGQDLQITFKKSNLLHNCNSHNRHLPPIYTEDRKDKQQNLACLIYHTTTSLDLAKAFFFLYNSHII